ncbi:hypothetical protein RDI58_015148 [Solanum bulbocastanum]
MVLLEQMNFMYHQIMLDL